MTATELHDYFDLLTDKVGNPYFTALEKDSFLTKASLEYVKQILPSNEGGIVNLEFDHVVYSNVYTLVFETSGLTPSGSGVITRSAVQTALNTASSGTDPFMYILNVSSNGLPVKYTRQNEWYEFQRNVFKQGSDLYPRYKQDSINFTFSPVNLTSVKFTLLKQPRAVVIGSSITSDLPDYTHEAIVKIAVDIASTSIRDKELAELNNK